MENAQSEELNTAVKEERWREVKSLLSDGNYNSSVVEQFITACEQYGVVTVEDDIVPHCTAQQLDRLLTLVTKKNRWFEIHCCLKAYNSREKRVWAIEQACKMAADWEFERFILPHCSDDQLESVLAQLVTQGRWESIGKVLERGVSDTHHRWAVEAASKTADDWDFQCYTLPYCSDDPLEYALAHLVTRGLWESVGKVLERGVSDTHHRWAVEEASKTADDRDYKRYILPHCSDDQLESVLTHLVTRGRSESVGSVLERGVSDTQHRWAVEEASQRVGDWDFKRYILPHCSDDQLESVLTHLVTRGRSESVGSVLERGVSDTHHRWAVEEASQKAHDKDLKDYILHSAVTHSVPHCLCESVCKCKVLESDISEKKCTRVLSELCKDFTVNYRYTVVMRLIQLQLEKQFESGVQLLITSLPSNTLKREAQSVALRFALQQRKWNVISRASLSQVWEQVRRHLFRKAVYQEQWTIVTKWADHTLYDDERWWALEEAYKRKQWDVMLQLADHGLTEIELMRVRYRLAKHADWDVVLRMIERGVDVTEVREVLESTMISRKTKTTTDRETQEALKLRWWQLRQLEEKLTQDSPTRLKLPSTARQWRTVLFHLHRHPRTATVPSRSQPSQTFGGLLRQCALELCAWPMVMHLVRLGMDTDQLDSLLTDMIRSRQWGVCRVLLEQGVSVQSCLSALSVFMEMNQWTLVTRVMKFIVDDVLKRQVEQLALDRSVTGSLVWQCVSAMCRYGMRVGDAVRLHVMQRAMERREGSVVGECISLSQHYRLSVKEREELFHQAISRGVLQAVKPLVEEKDETGIQHRDIAMLAAIEQRQWDVVDSCQLQGADIDMKDESGETPLNREVRKEDMNQVEWKAVEELVVRGAYPNVLDKDGCFVLNRAIKANQWDIVRLLIEYHGDIHMKARDGTPLPLLIDKRQGEIIHHTLMWCPDQAKGANDEGETTLHAIALDKKPELLYNQIVRGVNPLALTVAGHSVLFYAVMNKHCPQRSVGKCIRLGFSTHQPQLTEWTTVDMAEVATHASLNDSDPETTSPFLLAVLRGMPVVAHMLYESGSCSYSELLHLYAMLFDLTDPHTEYGRKLQEGEHLADWKRNYYFAQYEQRYNAFMNTLTTFLPYLREMASTPRSLVSTCRLVISYCLTVRRRRERAVQDLSLTDKTKNFVLPLPDRIKDFLLFSDLTDPDYQWFLYGTLPPLTVKKTKQNTKARRRQRQRGARRT